MAKQEQKAPPKKAGLRVKKKITRTIPSGIAHVQATFNNTIVVITDLAGNVISWSSAGKSNFAGSRKSSAFAATVAAQNAGRDAIAPLIKKY